MNIFNSFKKHTDVSETNKNDAPQISEEARGKFDRLLGDDKLQAKIEDTSQTQEVHSSSLKEKFEKLFGLEFNSYSKYDENEVSNRFETSENKNENSEVFVDFLEESMADNYRLPRNGGEWSGEPGNSEWEPDSNTIPGDRNGTNLENKTWKDIKKQYDFNKISFVEGRPDFSEVSKGDVEIDDFSDNRRKNFVQADEKLAEQKGCQPSEVRQWRTDNKYTWHEEADCKTMLKVPSEVHGNIPHDGGISEMKNQKNER